METNDATVPGNAQDTEPDLPSCDSCRKRKLRCSRESPSCANCVRFHTNCTYDYTRKRPGLKPGALDALTRRVETLEARAQGDDGETNGHSKSATSHDAQTSSAISLLVNELRQLNSNITTSLSTNNTNTIDQRTEDGSALDSGSATTSNSRKRPRNDTDNEDLVINQATRSARDDDEHAASPMLLSQGFVETLLAAYFKHVHPWIPMLHDFHDMNRLRQTGPRDEGYIVLHAIFIAAYRFMDETSPWEPSDLQWHASKSREFVVQRGMSTLTIENLQALTILAYIEIADGQTSKAWSIIGCLTRTVQYLQLSVEEDAPDTMQHTTLLSDLPEIPKSATWVECECRRRAFWNIFLLDRFCAIATGWKASLTADDVARRLPADGALWRRCQPAVTPYFGIWDNNSAKIGRTISFLPSKYGSPAEASIEDAQETATHHNDRAQGPVVPLRIGAFAYCIESVESLSRMNSFFLQQKINWRDREEVSSWLTRFKELDLRLVHWKKFLPQRWKNPSDTPNPATSATMDPNMTLAHVVHNTASIFLHQKIAYPSRELEHLRLPSACSADTCCIAASETSNIAVKYLQQDVVTRAIAPLLSICLFISAKILLIHSSFYKIALAPEFWELVKSLETISQNWKGSCVDPFTTMTLAGNLALQLRQLYDQSGPASPAIELFQARTPTYRKPGDVSAGVSPSISAPGEHQQQPSLVGSIPSHGLAAVSVTDSGIPQPHMPQTYGTPGMALDDLSAGLLDQNFLLRDRIINYDDFTFNTEMYGFPDMV